MYRFIPYIRIAFDVYYWLIIIRVVLSWVPHDPYKSIFRFIYEVTEPALAPFRKLMGRKMMIDFSPLFALLVLQVLEMLVLNLLSYL
ncbi:MAG: YggT family protein [Firmicutes bacterium HGW-Firmicutes-12]|jgi:YggT family protein|nr:MAG: YggT family protein [Firmicutes bacterium HGW-Firmicutes-12]